VLGGKIHTGASLNLLPGGNKEYKVRSMERHGAPVDEVAGGDRAAINLTGFKMDDFERGQVLTDQSLETTAMIDATLQLFTDEVLGLWTTAVFYSGTFECLAKIHLLNKDTLSKGDTAIVQIHLEKPAVLLNKDKFIIRNSSNDKTLGGGIVVDVKPLHHKRRNQKLIDALSELVEATIHSDKQFNTIKLELKKLKKPMLVEHLGELLRMEVIELLDECTNNNDGSVLIFEGNEKKILIHSETSQVYKQAILDELEKYHTSNFLLEEGMSGEEILGKLDLKSNESGRIYLKAFLVELKKEGLLKKEGNTWALQTHQVNIDKKTKQQLDWLENAILQYDKQTPLTKELESKAFQNKMSKENLKLYLKYLVSKGKICTTEGEYIHTNIVDEVKQKLLPVLTEKERGINEKEFRLLFNSTKNFVKTMIRILVEEGLVTKSEFHIHITEKGKNYK
jgi:selenocysteine-specific elongation factor